jgi:prepilin-type N-terminal cleavage/methylation domain-containing protein
MRAAFSRPNYPRRGVTLVEMLVVVALVVLMMVILVTIFQTATSAMSASKTNQDLDHQLRQLDARIKQDLAGVTARFTPPLDPTLKLGYFEYGENAFADFQGEDTDDYMAFTTKAPEGQVFTGRVFIPGVVTGGVSSSGNQAVQPVTITSQLAEVIYFLRNGNLYRRVFLIAPDRTGTLGFNPLTTPYKFPALSPYAQVSWLGVNDLSLRPAPTGSINPLPLLNDLGDLTNRENRAFRPRFRKDFFNNSTGASQPEGIDDDFNADDIPDFYPTLYPGVFSAGLVHEIPYPGFNSRSIATYDVHPFPYIYPGMYSHPETASLNLGWVHSIDPTGTTFNHAPLRTADNLPVPSPLVANGQCQTWWGFPTWRETLSFGWKDPAVGMNLGAAPTQQLGLHPFAPGAVPATNSANFLPPVTGQFANDGAGSASFGAFTNAPGVWDDDLVCTNVRSFDIKAYDPDASLYTNGGTNFLPSAGYYDLGFALQGNAALLNQTPTTLWDNNGQPQGFGHAGRIPPLTTDNRLNPSHPSVQGGINNNNVGDNNNGVIRLTRVWDTWSTDYTNAPDVDIFLNGYPGTNPGLPIYPSYPAPYTSPLRGIQIQIRIADPRNEHVKTLTIRQDFTDKL